MISDSLIKKVQTKDGSQVLSPKPTPLKGPGSFNFPVISQGLGTFQRTGATPPGKGSPGGSPGGSPMKSPGKGENAQDSENSEEGEEDEELNRQNGEKKKNKGKTEKKKEEEETPEPPEQSGRLNTSMNDEKGLLHTKMEEKEIQTAIKTINTIKSIRTAKTTKVAKAKTTFADVIRMALSDQKEKEMRESYIELKDLLPKGVESVQDLRRLYEEKSNIKRSGHLDCIPKVHRAEVLCAIFTPNYKFIVSGSVDRSIKIFDAETKQEISHIKEAHQEGVKTIAVTPNMKYLVSGSLDKSIKVFDFETKQPVHHFKDAHEHPIMSLAVTERYIISGSQGGSLKMFDLNTKIQSYHCPNIHHKKESIISVKVMRVVKVKPEKEFTVVLTKDGSIVVLDILTRQKVQTFEGTDERRRITSMVVTPDCNFIIAGCKDGSIIILEISTMEEVRCFPYEPESYMPLENRVNQVALSPDGQNIFAGFKDGSFVMWNIRTKEKRVLQGVNSGITHLAVSKRADFLIACSKQASIHLIDIEPKEKNTISLQKPCREGSSITDISLSISPDSKFILSAIHSNSIKIFDSKTKQEVFQGAFVFNEIITSLAVAPDNTFIIVGFHDGSLKVCDFKQKKGIHDFGKIKSGSVARTAVTPDSRYVITTADEDSLKIFDVIEKKEVHTFHKVHDATISSITVTHDNKFIVSASYDKSIKLFDIVNRKQVYHFKEVHKGEIYAVAVTPTNKSILSASRDFSIKMFDIETKHQVYEFVHAHDNSVFALSISSDSKYVASGSADLSVRVFDIETKQLVYSLQNLHSESVKKVAFAPNNRFLISVSLDDSIKFINFETIMKGHETLPFTWNSICAMAMSPDNELILTGSAWIISGINVKTKEKVLQIESDNHEKIKSMAVSSDNNFVVYGTEQGSIGVYDIQNRQKVHFLQNIHSDFVYSVAITPDDQFIVSGSKDKSIKIIQLETGKIEHDFKDIHEETVRSLCVTPDSQHIISSSEDKSIKIINIQTRNIHNFKDVHPRWIKCVTVSSDGKYFASCADDRSIKLFDFKTKQLVHWFKNAHDDFINTIVISQDCRFLVSGSTDRSIKVFDIQTRQLVHHFQKVHQKAIRHIIITSDNKSIISACHDGSIKFFKLTPTGPLPPARNRGIITPNNLDVSHSEIYYVYNGFSHYLNFNAIDDFLSNPNVPAKSAYATAIRCQNLTVYPYKWNILHLLAIKAQHTFIKNLPDYSKFKIPFILDAFHKTPLHYLIAQEKINLTSVNIILNYICDYLDGLSQSQRFQVQEIITSLTPLFWFILTKTDAKIRVRFFNICSVPLPIPYNTELPAFGKPRYDIAYFRPSIESIYPSIDDIWENGEDQIDFRTNIIHLDYNVLSHDMEKTVKCLSKQKNEEVFKTTLIFDLINNLWDQTKLFLKLNFLVFSAYLIALSVYLTLADRCLPFEIIIFCCSGFFLFAEGLQVVNVRQNYFRDLWNWIDIIFHPLTIAYVIARMLGTEDDLTRAWISTMIILFGYLRWISYLRIFKPTRNLIQVIVTVVNDMKSFIIIIGVIIVGFSFIFLVFGRVRNLDHLYGYFLNNAYSSLYGPVDDNDENNNGPSSSEQFFIALIAFLLNVILLNLLISIMGDSYAKVLEKRITTDSLTRLDLISEASTFLRFLRRSKTENRGFLVRCESLEPTEKNDDDDDDGDSWEERIAIMKDLLKQNEDSNQKEMKALQQNLARIEEKRKTNEEMLQQKMNVFEVELEKTRKEQEKQSEKTSEILALLIEMKQQFNGQSKK